VPTPTCAQEIDGGGPGQYVLDCSGVCVDTNSDVNHCLSCGEVCAGVKPGCCPNDSFSFAGGCTDLNSDPSNCGGCGTFCVGANRSSTSATDQVCTSGHCTCRANTTLCTGPGPDGCLDLASNPDACGRCGNACNFGELCVNGTCQCPDGGRFCSGACTDPQTDTSNCGACGKPCTDGDTCLKGACTPCVGEPGAGIAGTDQGCGCGLGPVMACDDGVTLCCAPSVCKVGDLTDECQ
jgi:hypothetical protein